MSDFRQALRSQRRLFFDGGLGTMLQSRGLPAGVSPERFSFERPDVLLGIHADYARAGADILITNTFGGTAFKLGDGLDVMAFNTRMASIAREAATMVASETGREIFVAGDMGPVGHFVKPLGDLEPADLIAAFREQVRGLVAGGVDLIIIETQFDLAEARAAVVAVRAETDLPVLVSMTFENGVSLTGSTPRIFVETMLNLGVDALGTNCSAGPEQMLEVVQEILAYSTVPVLVEPNAGLPELIDGTTQFRLPPQAFAEKTAVFAGMGVRLLGGCCGTTPDHIAALRACVSQVEAIMPSVPTPSGIVLTTRSHLVRVGGNEPLRIIGERINPTGKKALIAELQAGDFSLALRFADEQVAAGAPILDVNVGAPMVNEAELLPSLVQSLTARHGVPLSLDSSLMDALRLALPYCSGSSLINSISGEPHRMEELGPLCRDYGAPFILLPLQGRKLPVKATERIAIIEALLAEADALGIPRRLIMVDVLALAVSSKAEAARQCLETIRWCTANNLPTTIGLSNISFGLPARELLNTTFFAMAAGAGLSSCIAHPGNTRMRETAAAADVLLARDANAERFIAGYANWTPASGSEPVQGNATFSTAAILTLEDAVIRGDREGVVAIVEKELSQGAEPFALVQEKLIPAITEVGVRYERREYFLPQLIRSAETMQKAFAVLKPLLEAEREETKRPCIIMATVEGDIHDIGKNIVTLMLGNYGFDVVDLGKDVKAIDIVDAAEKHGASIIGLSALMTTTMVRMEDTVKLIKERDLNIRVIIGGAVVTAAFAESIGADGYSEDAVGAVRLAKSLLPA